MGVTDADALVTVGEAESVLVGDALTSADIVAENEGLEVCDGEPVWDAQAIRQNAKMATASAKKSRG